MFDKTYNHAEIEPRISGIWHAAHAFAAGRALKDNPKAKPFSIVIPPPNVTGSLHMGHALNNTLQDVMARFERMRGRDVLWQPGTDHAGIATQSLVERQLMERQEPSRQRLLQEHGPAEARRLFLEKVWAWKAQSGGTIINQLKRLGASCDWSRERFTMDEGLSRAVTKVFVDLYNEGLIYKDKRLVNWDPMLQTAISDLEVISVEKKGTFAWDAATADETPFDAAAFAKVIDRDPDGHLYYFKYPLAGEATYRHPVAVGAAGHAAAWGERGYIVVATTRPETMLGDMAVAVHPDDPRYKPLVDAGAKVTLPLVGREIPINADAYADPEQGTGAVKITPAHDFNDFEVGKRANPPLEPFNIFTKDGRVIASIFDQVTFGQRSEDPRHPGIERSNDEGGTVGALEHIPEQYRGLDRFAARKLVVQNLAQQTLLQRVEPHEMKVPYGDRSNVAVEPYLTDQWYVDAETLAQPALQAVRGGKTDFIPENWRKVYFDWLENIQPWCISRQLWWATAFRLGTAL